ncbi:MAG: AAA family ATPase [Planctomycetaceae bacterium]|nr:AAA family ATPase [Planctomycetaceae bacterium]
MTLTATPKTVTSEGLDELFNRVNMLLGDPGASAGTSRREPIKTDAFVPQQPRSMRETGINSAMIEKIIMRFLFQVGVETSRRIAAQLRLPYKVLEPLFKQLRADKHIDLAGTTSTGDSEYCITESGRDRARRYSQECTYFGAVPVALEDYVASVSAQSIAGQIVTKQDLNRAFKGLIINDTMLNRLGPAVNSGRGMFLFGEPGNGKTSIAERITDAFGSSVWIPRAIAIEGEIMRIFDPAVHEEVSEEGQSSGLLDSMDIDRRWVQVKRPTVIAGGELTMDELEITLNQTSRICESPLQVKSNCGTLVIDDFGRQKMPVDMLLNRWIVPLEKRFDYLNMPNGKKIQMPFDQLIIFSTNLEPKDLVDGAFLRRIPYKIEVPDPSETEFVDLFRIMSEKLGFKYRPEAINYLVENHYKPVNRPYRLCQPRDLLLQVRNFCQFHSQPLELTFEAFDAAVLNYFSVME